MMDDGRQTMSAVRKQAGEKELRASDMNAGATIRLWPTADENPRLRRETGPPWLPQNCSADVQQEQMRDCPQGLEC
jgi:hypothetical protein